MTTFEKHGYTFAITQPVYNADLELAVCDVTMDGVPFGTVFHNPTDKTFIARNVSWNCSRGLNTTDTDLVLRAIDHLV